MKNCDTPTTFDVDEYDALNRKYSSLVNELDEWHLRGVLRNQLMAALPYPINPLSQALFVSIENHHECQKQAENQGDAAHAS